MPPESDLLKLYIQIGVLKYSERNGKSFATKFDRMKKLCWNQYFQIDFKLILIKSISRRFESVRSNDKSDRNETWNIIIIHRYGSDETGFVEIRVRDKNGYF